MYIRTCVGTHTYSGRDARNLSCREQQKDDRETKINNEDTTRGYIPVGPPAPGLSSVTTLSSSLLDSPLSRRSRSGLLAITEVLFDGIGNDGFGRPCIAAKACCTASWRTSVHSELNDQANEQFSQYPSTIH